MKVISFSFTNIAVLVLLSFLLTFTCMSGSATLNNYLYMITSSVIYFQFSLYFSLFSKIKEKDT